tara:strand:- start:3752 stop:4921 length:1170 start_codon:yes stop_codon:yes gene_type:complete
MKLGFYSHITVKKNNNRYFIPSHIGIYISHLVSDISISKLFLFAHRADKDEYLNCDFEITNSKIDILLLGNKKNAPYRMFFGWIEFLKFRNRFLQIDKFIVRVPTPLFTAFRFFVNKSKLIFLIVANEAEGANNLTINKFRDFILKLFLLLSDFLLLKFSRGITLLPNSKILLDKFKGVSKSVFLVSTTTVSKEDIIKKNIIVNNKKIKILFVGRIDPNKGLDILIDSIEVLKNKKYNFSLSIIGWEDNHSKYTSFLKEKIQNKNLDDVVSFKGKKNLGPDLYKYYRDSDIFIMPSFNESFPRTIWESMASGCVVIASKVGAIPLTLSHEENCLLVDKKNSVQLTNSIELLINKPQLRSHLSKNAYKIVNNYTIENQSKILINLIKNKI